MSAGNLSPQKTVLTVWEISYQHKCFKAFLLQSNLVIRNFLVTLKLFLNAKCSLSLWSKLVFCHGKWFLNTNLFLIKTFLTTKFDCIYFLSYNDLTRFFDNFLLQFMKFCTISNKIQNDMLHVQDKAYLH